MHRIDRSLNTDLSADLLWPVLRNFSAIDEFHPGVKSVDVLGATSGESAKRRCNFFDGTSVVEEVIEWREGHGYRVRLSEFNGMPMASAFAELEVEPNDDGGCRVHMVLEYRVKYGPFGYVLGATAMRLMMRKVMLEILRGLIYRSQTGQPVSDHVPPLESVAA